MKSDVRDQIELLRCIYLDACNMCTADVSDLRDLITIESRVEHEGLSFLTISLPAFMKDLDRSLEAGFVDSTMFLGFKKIGSIPAFLQGMTSQLFDVETGRMINDEFPRNASADDFSTVVAALRQICRAFTKLEIDCTPEREEKAIEGFVNTEHQLRSFSIDDDQHDRFSRVSRLLWDVCLSGFDLDDLRPKHGPGTTAEGLLGNEKYNFIRWHERVEQYFPFFPNALSLSAYGEKVFDSVAFVQESEEQPVKVVSVPKTQKTPRIIAIEPAVMQYAQQSLRSWLYARIEKSRMSRGHVNFRDQSVNQRLALISSKDKSLATIDLSDASDRVPLSLVRTMFESASDSSLLWETIESCRSRFAKLPDGRLIGPLLKFASMGSALCFPVEAMYFYTCCVEALLGIRDLPVTRENVFTCSRDVYVYGDDLLIPSIEAVAVLERLAMYNCKANASKSFWTGKFRESCGLDAYDGVEVTPTYIRKLHPKNRRDYAALISFSETAASFYLRGMWNTAQYLYEQIEGHLGPLPFVGRESSVIGRISFQDWRTIDRWNPKYHRFEVNGWIPDPVHRTDVLEGYPALQKCLLKLETMDFESLVPEDRDRYHLERTARYGIVTLKRRWAPSH